VLWLVQQSRIKNPAAWIAANTALVAAPAAPVEPEALVEIGGDIPIHRDPVELEPGKLRVGLAKTSGASPPMVTAGERKSRDDDSKVRREVARNHR
jgi:hypothetical protein